MLLYNSDIENKEIQITIQGQTISSNFGTLESCRYNLENLLSAGAANQVFYKGENKLTSDEKELLEELSKLAIKNILILKIIQNLFLI